MNLLLRLNTWSDVWTFEYIKGRNLHGKKISRISRILAKFAKINSFFNPRNVGSQKLIPAKFFKIGDSRKLVPAKFLKN